LIEDLSVNAVDVAGCGPSVLCDAPENAVETGFLTDEAVVLVLCAYWGETAADLGEND
jgi:hypothetical protein